ncbi:unnamed protein product [Paramecium primaurelia]|uniref:Uncharacterized protein n=1 Tax=Paramecium primaurelia TaxID=5886 RepID=A0A8S1Q759_PARPR|nr:unnamed protein product [Paramecium primaurelia]
MNNLHQFDRSLLTVDILGAQTKQKSSYLDKINPYDIRQNNNLKLHKILNMVVKDINMISIILIIVVFLKERIILMVHIKSIIIYKKEKSNNIEHQKIIMINLRNLQGDRLLATNDIEGAIPGTSTSKVVRNQEKAQKLRQERDYLRAQNNKALYLSQLESKIDHQSESEKQPQRIKSYSISPTPQNQIFENKITEPQQPKYEYMNKPLKLPPILNRETPISINPISNKLQLHQNQKNYLLQDYDKTLSMLQQNLPTRLYV